MTEKIRTKELESRGWDRSLRTFYLPKNSPYDLAEVEAIEATPEWQHDAALVAEAKPFSLIKSELRQRGWTEALLKRFYPNPDKVIEINGKRKAYLYRVQRLAEIEATSEWQEAATQAVRRSQAASKAAETRKQETLARIRQAKIRVPKLPLDLLARRAVEHRNWVTDSDPATVSTASEEALRRWEVNYLRHELTDYDDLLDALHGQYARDEATRILRRRVYDAIAAAYPHLAEECARQQWERSA